MELDHQRWLFDTWAPDMIVWLRIFVFILTTMSASKYFKEDEQQKSGRSDLKNIKIFCPSDSPQYICRSLWHLSDIFTTAPSLLQICTSSCGQVSFILTSFDFCIAESSVLNAQGFVEPSNVWQCCPCLICAPHIWPHLAPVEVVFLHFTSQAKGSERSNMIFVAWTLWS